MNPLISTHHFTTDIVIIGTDCTIKGGFCALGAIRALGQGRVSNIRNKGFTLIELSIVLVIIGLLIGGLVAGNDMRKSAEVRSQITQIEKIQTATNTFKAKFNALPGDMDAKTAVQFGFAPRGSNEGQGDGNGILEGWNSNYNSASPDI